MQRKERKRGKERERMSKTEVNEQMENVFLEKKYVDYSCKAKVS